MIPFKIKRFIIPLIVAIITLSMASSAISAQKGHQGKISKEELLLKLKKIQGKYYESVDGYIIEGTDIISIIEETDIDIKIRNSIIKGGLDFTKLPGLSLDNLELPEAWSGEKKTKWRQTKILNSRYYQVTNRIAIHSSDIESPDKKLKISIKARGVIFNRFASFLSSTFSGNASFVEATFIEKASFAETIFNGNVYFSSSTFIGNASFIEATFIGNVYFSSSTFSGNASFLLATFSGDASFKSATFNGNASFISVTFMKLANFSRASFFTCLVFRKVDIQEYADLRNTQITRLDCNSVHSPTIISGRLDLRGAVISEAHIQDFIFEKDVYLSDAKFGILIVEKDSNPRSEKNLDKSDIQTRSSFATVFRFVTFESLADFKRAKFKGNTAFENVTFLQDANFIDADFNAEKEKSDHKFSLSYLSFKNLFINLNAFPARKYWSSDLEARVKSFSDIAQEVEKQDENYEEKVVYKLEPLSHVLKSLGENFRKNNQLDDANRAYYHRKRAELEEAENGDDFWLQILRKSEWIFMGIPCGYGTKIYWIIGWSTLMTLLFAILYSLKGEVSRNPHPETEQEFVFKQRFLDFPKHYYSQDSMLKVDNQFARNFINALRLSAVILFKVGYRDTKISGEIFGMNYRYFVWIEWALGYYILGAFVVTLSNTLPLLNRLITGVF
ncbi:MAG: hypothetical protein ACI8PB_004881 [Desulforhopalus sp.]|jgi:hypothetical protein